MYLTLKILTVRETDPLLNPNEKEKDFICILLHIPCKITSTGFPFKFFTNKLSKCGDI